MQSAQTSELATFLDKFPSGDLIALFAIAVVFATAFLITLVVTTTWAIAHVRVASINAKMVATLTQAGHSAEEIERIVASVSGGSKAERPGRWRPARQQAVAGKSVPA